MAPGLRALQPISARLTNLAYAISSVSEGLILEMDKRNQLLARVREDAESIIQLTRGLNFPIGHYLDETDLNALCDAFGLDPEIWTAEDLEKILLLRDGLYELRHNLRDKGSDPDAEHSVDQMLAGMDRLYVDFERALRELGKQELVEAQSHLTRLRQGPRANQSSPGGRVVRQSRGAPAVPQE